LAGERSICGVAIMLLPPKFGTKGDALAFKPAALDISSFSITDVMSSVASVKGLTRIWARSSRSGVMALLRSGEDETEELAGDGVCTPRKGETDPLAIGGAAPRGTGAEGSMP